MEPLTFQTHKVKLFANIVFDYKPIIFVVKSSNLDVWLVLCFYVLLVKILYLEKRHIISTPICLSLLSQEKMWFWWSIKRGGGGGRGAGRGVAIIKMGRCNIKNFIWEGSVNKWKLVKWVAVFFKNWYCPTPFNYVTQSNINSDYIFKNCLYASIYIILFCLAFSLFCAFQEKTKPSWRKYLIWTAD